VALRLAADLFDCGMVLSGFALPLPAPAAAALARRRPPVFSGRADRDPLIPSSLVAHTDGLLDDAPR
jgi:phospholipase/carboxylesterase